MPFKWMNESIKIFPFWESSIPWLWLVITYNSLLHISLRGEGQSHVNPWEKVWREIHGMTLRRYNRLSKISLSFSLILSLSLSLSIYIYIYIKEKERAKMYEESITELKETTIQSKQWPLYKPNTIPENYQKFSEESKNLETRVRTK